MIKVVLYDKNAFWFYDFLIYGFDALKILTSAFLNLI